MEALADFLVDRAPQGIGSVYFVSGGSEAVEAALKMARQYFLEIGQPERTQVIARRQSYHGNTLGALATGGNAWRRRPFEPLLADTTHVSPCYAYDFVRQRAGAACGTGLDRGGDAFAEDCVGTECTSLNWLVWERMRHV